MPRLVLVAVVLLAALPSAGAARIGPPPLRIDLVPIAVKYRSPVYVADPGDGTGRLFVVEQRGVIKPVHNGVPSKKPFLDIRKRVRSGDEQGLLSLAFHPNYTSNATFFVAHTDNENSIVVSSFRASARRPDRADPESERVLLRVRKRFNEHNGGMLIFGPDSCLYISVGDGGRDAEPDRNAQRLDTLLGKLLRIDVDHPTDGRPYGIPPDIPFVGVPNARPEIWAYGLRNPWRFSFDRDTGDLYIGDVGGAESEEVNVQPAGSAGGENYGWNVFEGTICHWPNSGAGCDGSGMVAPVWEYGHTDNACAAVGGYVYRGAAFPELVGAYLVADVCAGRVWLLRQHDEGWAATVLFELNTVVSSFAEDSAGELYVIGLRGHVYQLMPGTGAPSDGTLRFTCLPSSGEGGWQCGAAESRAGVP
jgi:glucose/arabinose dehydrogenase